MASAEIFALNPSAQVHVQTFGENCPVLVIDDVFADPGAVRKLALGGGYDASLAYYPGVHSDIAFDLLRPLFTQLAHLVSNTSGMRCEPEAFTSDFSLVTTPAREMLAKQKHPHVDGIPLAGVVYLNPASNVGTSFFRHLPTGLATILSAEDAQRYNEWMEREGELTQPETYAVASDHVWQQLHTIEGRYNRLVLYPGNAFHSIAMVDVEANITLESARLTQRLFVNRLAS